MLGIHRLLLGILASFCVLALVVPGHAVILNGVDYVLFACERIDIVDTLPCSTPPPTVITGNVAVNNPNGVLVIGACNMINGTATAHTISFPMIASVTFCSLNISTGGGSPSGVCGAVAPAPLPLVACPPLPVPVIPSCVNTAPDVVVPAMGSLGLVEGCYGDILVDVGAILTLGPGIFNVHKLTLRSGSTLNGSGILATIVNVKTTITGGPNETIANVTLNTVAPPPGSPVVEIGLNNVAGDLSVLMNVLIYAPNDRVRLYRWVTGTGLEIVADEIVVGRMNDLSGP